MNISAQSASNKAQRNMHATTTALDQEIKGTGRPEGLIGKVVESNNGQIARVLQELEKSVAGLNEQLLMLNDVIRPAMGPLPEYGASCQVPINSDFGNFIINVDQRIRDMAAYVQAMRNAVEL